MNGRVLHRSMAFMACMFLSGVAFATPVVAGPPAKAQSVIVRPLKLLTLGDLDFGTMMSGPTAGTVVIDANTDARTSTGGVVLMGGSPGAARFISYGLRGRLLLITRGPLPVLTRAGGGGSINVTQLKLNGPALRILAADGTLDIRVGGTLVIPANQPDGVYTGTFNIYVNYF